MKKTVEKNVRFCNNVSTGISGLQGVLKMKGKGMFVSKFKKIIMVLSCVFVIHCSYSQTETITWTVDGQTYATTNCESGYDVILPQTPTKQGYTFIGWKTFTPVEYIESTGTQYIDTGIGASETSKIVISIQIPSDLTGADQKLFGNTADVRMQLNTFKGYYRDTKIPVSSNKTEITIQRSVPVSSSSLTVEYDNNIYTQENNNWWFCSSVATFPIFGSCGCNNSVCGARYKCFYFKQYDLTGNLVRDMVPVTDPDEIPCMYDIISKQCFYSLGADNLIAGPLLSD